jgi:drug/metabolite transporter (DMT)-like permease
MLTANAAAPIHSTMITAPSRLVGYVAIAVTVLCWSGFSLSIRAIGGSHLAPADVALIRFGLPCLLMLPWLPRCLPAIRALRARDMVMISMGAGLPFFFLSSLGGRSTSAAHVAAIIAGGAPAWTALAGLIFERRPIAPALAGAMMVILVGVAFLTLRTGSVSHQGFAEGFFLLIAAGLCWGCYTFSLRSAGLDAIGSTLLLCLPNMAVLIVMIAAGAVHTNLATITLADAVPFVLVQGLGVGIVGGLAYVIAIARIGATPSAAIGSLAPVISTLLAIPLFGEWPTPAIAAGLMLIVIGALWATTCRRT